MDPLRAPFNPLPPEAWEPLARLVRRARRLLARLLQREAASGVLLLLAAALALLWANSPWRDSYARLWDTPLAVRLGDLSFQRPLLWFVNDGLMVLFFFSVGLEIRRELFQGALRDWRRASLPAAAALGGMVVPALIYLLITSLGSLPGARRGWGVPMATDIAFALGVLTLLGRRIPTGLHALLLALAVLDDLGAILVIALFYQSGLSAAGVLVAGVGFALIFLMQAVGIRHKLAYVFPAVVAWSGTYAAGVHPTLAGVLVGLITPVRPWLGPAGFIESTKPHLEEVAQAAQRTTASSPGLSQALHHVEAMHREVMSPSESLHAMLQPWVAFLIMPIFALANAGVSLKGLSLDRGSLPIALGCAVALLVGKPLGILAFSALALRLRIAGLPPELRLRHLGLLGVVAGIGFTMSLFIAQLAFMEERLLVAAKLGVLAASAAAALLGFLLGRLTWLHAASAPLSAGSVNVQHPHAAGVHEQHEGTAGLKEAEAVLGAEPHRRDPEAHQHDPGQRDGPSIVSDAGGINPDHRPEGEEGHAAPGSGSISARRSSSCAAAPSGASRARKDAGRG